MVMALPDTIRLGIGATRIDAGKPVHWIVPPRVIASLQIYEYPDHLIVSPLTSSVDVEIGIQDGDAVQWVRVTTSAEPKPPAPKQPLRVAEWIGRAKNVVASAAASNKVRAVALVGLLAAAVTMGRGCSWPDWSHVIPSPIVNKTEKAYIVVAEDGSKRTPAEGKTILDLEAKAVTHGHKFALVSVHDPEFKQSGYDVATKNVGLPAVLIFDAGKLVTPAFKLDPETAAGQVGKWVKW